MDEGVGTAARRHISKKVRHVSYHDDMVWHNTRIGTQSLLNNNNFSYLVDIIFTLLLLLLLSKNTTYY